MLTLSDQLVKGREVLDRQQHGHSFAGCEAHDRRRRKAKIRRVNRDMLGADAYLKRATDQQRRRKLDEPELIEDVFRIADRGRYLTLDQDVDGCRELLDTLAVARQLRAQPAHRHISRDLRTAVRHDGDRIPPCFDILWTSTADLRASTPRRQHFLQHRVFRQVGPKMLSGPGDRIPSRYQSQVPRKRLSIQQLDTEDLISFARSSVPLDADRSVAFGKQEVAMASLLLRMRADGRIGGQGLAGEAQTDVAALLAPPRRVLRSTQELQQRLAGYRVHAGLPNFTAICSTSCGLRLGMSVSRSRRASSLTITSLVKTSDPKRSRS